jgi:iron complex outermembrane recepter protein
MRTLVAMTIALLSVVAVQTTAYAQTSKQRYDLNIARQALDSALKDLAQQTGLQIARLSDTIDGAAMVGPLTGQLSAEQALESLLGESGLTFKVVNERTIAVVKPGAEVPLSSTPAAATQTAMRLAQGKQSEDSLPQTMGSSNTDEPAKGVTGAQEALEEVVVTAQKRTERLIDAPQSVSVLSGDDLFKLGAVQLRDYANHVPALSFTTIGAGYTKVSLRGVTTGFDNNPTVGIYIDEVPYGSSSAFAFGGRLALDAGLFDIDRIEILRGPQGTLYGASSIGGLLKYVTKQPDVTDFDVQLRAGMSGTEKGGFNYNGAVAVNVPMGDRVALRASGFQVHDAGYVDNPTRGAENVDRSDVYGGRLDLLLEPTDALNVRLVGYGQNIDREGITTVDYAFSGAPLGDDLDQLREFAEPFGQHFRLASGTVSYDFGAAVLTSISAYQSMRVSIGFDLSRFLVPVFSSLGLPYDAIGLNEVITTNKFTEELRLASNGDGRWEWLLGAFYTRESSKDAQGLFFRTPPSQVTLNALTPARSRYEESAAFGDLTYHFTEEFDMSAGLRYSKNRQSRLNATTGNLARSDENVATYLANARYHFNERATGYLRYATGYRPGGANFGSIDPFTGLPLGPDTFAADRLKSYEIGFKSESVDRRLGIDAAVYYIDWSDIQVLSARSGIGFFVNANAATVRGAELTLTARPVRSLLLGGVFAYTKPTLADDAPDLGARSGERLPNVPDFTAALNADYELPLRSLRPTVGATVRYSADREASFDQSASGPQYYMPDYTTVDLRAGLTIGSVDAQLYIRNLADERGQVSAFTFFGGPQPAILQPRTIGVSATAHF